VTRAALRCAAWLACLAGPLAAQAEAPEPAFARLAAELERTDASGQRPPIARQRALLEEFVAAHREASDAAVLRARVLLGTLLLHRLEAAAALAEFRAVASRCKPDDRDLAARAQYGIAQALELLGDAAGARAQLGEVARAHAGTRYGDLASAAVRRLEAGQRAEVGKPAPRFGPVLDRKQTSVELRALRGGPVALVFWSPDSAASVRTLQRVQALWRQHRQPWSHLVAFALDGDAQRLDATVREQRIEATVVPCAREAIEPVVLDYGVTALPSVHLIAPEGTLVARTPSLQTFAELLARLLE
jgi:hypothetical protein